MEQVFAWLLAVGYPKAGVDWLRRRRAAIIIVLALLSWALFIGAGWLLVSILF